MLLEDNNLKIVNIIEYFDELKNVDKVRLAIYILENKNFNIDYNVNNIINKLKIVMSDLDPDYNKVIVNFSKYKNLVLLSSKYMELDIEDKKRCLIELLFNIYESDFEDKYINELINNNLDVYNFAYLSNVSVK